MSVMLNSLPGDDARLDVLTQTRFDCTPLLSAAVWNKLQSVQVTQLHHCGGFDFSTMAVYGVCFVCKS